MNSGIGDRFANAVAKKDGPALLDLLDPDVDFRALTPGRFWEASSARALVEEVIFGAWFEAEDHIDALEDVQIGAVADRDRVGYRLRITNADGVFLVEQQAYFDVENDRISWLRILCSGYVPIDDEPTSA